MRPGSDDHIFREMLVTVWNRILLRLQDARLTEKEIEEIGFVLRRVWVVGKAYAEKGEKYAPHEWVKRLKDLALEAGVEPWDRL